MPRETLLDFFHDLSQSRDDFITYDDGYRIRTFTYAEIADAARRFAGRLNAAVLSKGDKVVFWGENRPGWIVGFWGCMLTGCVVVPLDHRAQSDFVLKIAALVRCRLILVGEEISTEGLNHLEGVNEKVSYWKMRDLEPAGGPGVSLDLDPLPNLPPAAIGGKDIAQIIFTSGATAEPKGVIVTHRNLLANLIPVEKEVIRYRAYARPFFPLRFLNLLPLSHLFGQALALFIPPMLSGTVVFMRGNDPAEIVRQIKRRGVSVVVTVPKILEVLRTYIAHLFPGCDQGIDRLEGAPKVIRIAGRWLRYRKIHHAFGWKCWSFVVGAAPLDPALETFWTRLGFLVIQGYGLTEAAPVVTLNHPLNARAGGEAPAGH